ncbi:hypothetical protein VFPPC_16193 [Pochonia chlamydosporia 170]|uniref:Uncharacterized protein n=1 Tax=Pochonia chlamydosporia 170 TaxID=1380566 RepID=A0A179FFT8_METCM|nr:hypothetical protein VFPPC_16193 [Pochonia chlamydosporia 170]OAQ64277.2 hypothetical protein VFPPC_16193 [Pochonia chlamydosporia 170]
MFVEVKGLSESAKIKQARCSVDDAISAQRMAKRAAIVPRHNLRCLFRNLPRRFHKCAVSYRAESSRAPSWREKNAMFRTDASCLSFGRVVKKKEYYKKNERFDRPSEETKAKGRRW